MKFSILFTALTVLAVLPVDAQQHVKITDPGVIKLDPDLRKNKAAQAGLQASGITAEQQELVLQFSDPQYWPVGLKNDSLRQVNAPYIQNYSAFTVCTYVEDSANLAVVMVPARENVHMPEELRPVADFYLVVPAANTTIIDPPKPRPTISRGPRWKSLPEARILKGDELYATYDLSQDSLALAALAKRGMDKAEIDAVIFRSHERNWPEGIDDFSERATHLKDFGKYKAYLGARWGDKLLLIVPAEKNRSMPVLMRPYVDIYFVYAASAVEVKKSKKSKK